MTKISRLLELLSPWHKEADVESRETATKREVSRAELNQRRLDILLRSFTMADVIYEKREKR